MAYVSIPHAEHRPRTRSTTFFADCGAALGMFGAAVRVSGAVRQHRQPDARDLKILGIPHPLPGL